MTLSRLCIAYGDEHAEETEIDLGLREETTDRCLGRGLCLTLYRCRVGHVRHGGGPPDPCWTERMLRPREGPGGVDGLTTCAVG